MKRRHMIAKALSHEPEILFLDEPTAGVDVELRRDMWKLIRSMRDEGVTIILTTHYIEEAEDLADRVGIILKGELIVVEEKAALMSKLGKKQLTLELQSPLEEIPEALAAYPLELANGGGELVFTYDTQERAHRHHRLARRSRQGRDPLQGPADQRELAGGHLRQSGEAAHMNLRAVQGNLCCSK